MANEPSYVLELIKLYVNAQNTLIKIVTAKHERKSNYAYERRVMNRVNETLKRLNNDSSNWSNENIPFQYKKSVNKLVRDFDSMGIAVDGFERFTKTHEKRIDVLIRNTNNKLRTANTYIGRRIQDTVRQISIESVAQAQAMGVSVKQLRQDLTTRFVNNNILAIKTRTGKNINIEAYAGTVARSTMTEAQNKATMIHSQELGYDLVQMSEHHSPCPICAPLESRIYSISGNDTRYPPLDFAFGSGYANIHPNCRHILLPYIEKLDDSAALNRRFSNRPFDIDPRSKAEIDKYNKQQKENAERNRDKRQYERYKLTLKEKAPKTFAGFRKMKKSNSGKYQELLSEYKSKQIKY